MACCHFLCYVLGEFDSTNMTLQAQKPLIHKSRRILRDLYKTILTKFLTPPAFSGQDILDIDISVPYHQKSDSEVAIGENTREFMREKEMKEEQVKEIIAKIRKFYKAAAKYMAEKLPMKDPLLKNAEVFDLRLLPRMQFASVRYFTERFNNVKPSCSMDELEQQFSSLQVEEIEESVLNMERADEQWAEIGGMVNSSGKRKYADLAHLAQNVLLIPHSNAECERVFSNVRKIRTDFRGSMKASTLEAICLVKMRMHAKGEVCYDGTFSREETKEAKKATVRFNSAT